MKKTHEPTKVPFKQYLQQMHAAGVMMPMLKNAFVQAMKGSGYKVSDSSIGDCIVLEREDEKDS